MKKVAVLISGIVRGNLERNIRGMLNHFPDADYFLSTWNSSPAGNANIDTIKRLLPNAVLDSFPEPVIKYNCLTDVPKEMLFTPKLRANASKASFDKALKNRVHHHTKQILGHAYQMQEHDLGDYDLIIRLRYDTYLHPRIDMTPFLNESIDNNCAIGFGVRNARHNSLFKTKRIPSVEPKGKDSNDWFRYLMDPMIIHPPSLFDPEEAFRLDAESKLLPAENGWYQLLSKEDNHICYYGVAQIEKYLNKTGDIR